jgi:hypothetical protein
MSFFCRLSIDKQNTMRILLRDDKAREAGNRKARPMKTTHFIVQTSASCMPSSCKGFYRNVAVLEVDDSLSQVSMISERARGCRRIVWYSGKNNVGTTERCAYRRALRKAEELAAKLNDVRDYL